MNKDQEDKWRELNDSILDINVEDRGYDYPELINVQDGEIIVRIIYSFGEDRSGMDQGLFVKWNTNYEMESNLVFLDLNNYIQGWLDCKHLYEYVKQNKKQL